ncbi:MAG: MBOAT family protein, partial [Clostridia bacterium]|nr:MBOAT family protein [Clostridia bacterium]
MVFSSIFFLFVFLPVVLALYYVVPRRFKNLLLFVCSLIFYAWGEPVYILIMLFTAFIDYFNGAMVDKYRDRPKIAKAFVCESVIVNLSLLGFFKYSGLLVETFNGLTGLAVPVPQVALPIGISFYTFQSMSYTIDIYRNRAPRQHHIVDYG